MQLWSVVLWREKGKAMSLYRDREYEYLRSQSITEIKAEGDIMNPDLDSSPRTELYQYQPQLSRLQGLAEEIGSTFHRFSGVLNAISDGHADECYPRKRIRLMLCGIKSAEEESTLLGSVGAGAAELPMASSNINYPANVLEMGPMDGPSNDDSCIVLKSTSSTLGSPEPVNICKEEDYIASINLVQDYLDKIKNIVECGGSPDLLKAAVSAMEHVTDMLTDMSASSSLSHSRL